MPNFDCNTWTVYCGSSGFVELLDPGRYVTSAISHWRAAPTTEESDQTGGWEAMFDRPACQHVGHNQSTIQCPSSSMISCGISTRTKGCIGKPSIPVIGFLRDGGQQIVFQTPISPRGRDIAATFIEVDRQDTVVMNGKRSVDDRPGPRNRRAGKAEIAEPGGTKIERWQKYGTMMVDCFRGWSRVRRRSETTRTAQSVPSIKLP